LAEQGTWRSILFGVLLVLATSAAVWSVGVMLNATSCSAERGTQFDTITVQ